MNARRWLITASVCVALFAALAAYKYFQIQAAIAYGQSFPEPSETVESMIAKSVDTEFFTTTIGEVVAPEYIQLRNELGGRITRINMRSGMDVKQGDVLVQLDIAEEQAQLQAAQATANLARLNLQREQGLIKKNLTSQESVDSAAAQFEIAEASVKRLQAQIDKKTLTAPFAAHVGIHTLEVGQYLNANTSLVELVGKNTYSWVDFKLPVTTAPVAIGTDVLVQLPNGKGERQAKVIATDVTLSAQSRNRRYRAQLAADPGLIPNTVVDVKISHGVKPQVQIPKPALLQDVMGTYVFRLEEDAQSGGFRAQRQPITTGRETANTIIVKEGLAPGTRIATHGAFKLHSGLLVFTQQAPLADASATEQ